MFDLPTSHLSEDLVQQLRAASHDTELLQQLPADTLQLIYEKEWLRVMIPTLVSGLEWPLPKIVKLFEDLARADANVGWCVNLGAGANMFAGYFTDTTARKLFYDAKTWCAGSGAVSGHAERTAGGYLLSGQWKYASGANHATHFTANAYLSEEKHSNPSDFRSFIIPAASVKNHRNWSAIGLKSTSSNDFSIDKVFVPVEETFSLNAPSPHATGALYQFPFACLAVVNMASMMTGITLNFVEAYTEFAQQKKTMAQGKALSELPAAQQIVSEQWVQFASRRQSFFDKLANCWKVYEAGDQATDKVLISLENAAREAAFSGLQLIQKWYPLCGMSILDPQSALNKIWRDAHTASQHYLLSPLYNSE